MGIADYKDRMGKEEGVDVTVEDIETAAVASTTEPSRRGLRRTAEEWEAKQKVKKLGSPAPTAGCPKMEVVKEVHDISKNESVNTKAREAGRSTVPSLVSS